MTPLYARLFGALLLLLLLAVPAQAADTVPIDVVDGAVVWTPDSPYAQAMLTLSSPSGMEYRRAFGAGQAVRLHPSEMGDVPLADGFYEYRLVLAATIPDADEPAEAKSLTGTIEVRDGQAVASPLLDIQHLDDVIITFSLCVGNDCVNGESFGFDTIRLKENNLRIHFQDTSTSASFPTNDWRIVINDTNNGGGSFFGIEDSDTTRRVFRIDAGAPTDALRIDSGGDLGLGTANPVVDIHTVNGNTPTLRLDQDGSSGFTPYVWDMAGNEAGFFIRDVSNGSKLVFRIRPGAPTSSIDIAPTGNVGIGTSSPDERLDVDGGDVVIQENSAGAGGNLTLVRNAAAGTPDGGNLTVGGFSTFTDGLLMVADYTAALPSNGSVFRIRDAGALAGAGDNILNFRRDGRLTVTGSMNATAFNVVSDVNQKRNFAPVDAQSILNGVASLPLSTWEYISEERAALHLGPMAQDFRAAFGLGESDTRISTIDLDGVALASIQALHARNEAASARIAELEAANEALEARLARLEALLGADHE